MPTANAHTQTRSSTAQRAWRALGLVCLIACAIGLWSAAPVTHAATPGESARTTGFQVIVHASNPQSTLSQELLTQAFLKRTTRWSDGQPMRPVDLRPDSAARRAFSDRVLKRSVLAVRSYWQQRIFSGRELPPPELDSDAAVVQFVQSSPGSIGYVSAAAKLAGDVKTVAVR